MPAEDILNTVWICLDYWICLVLGFFCMEMAHASWNGWNIHSWVHNVNKTHNFFFLFASTPWAKTNSGLVCVSGLFCSLLLSLSSSYCIHLYPPASSQASPWSLLGHLLTQHHQEDSLECISLQCIERLLLNDSLC